MNTENMDVDLSNCDREPIHQLGMIQGFGALIAINSDWFVGQRSANLEEMLGLDEPVEIGARMSSFVSQKAFERLRSAVAALLDPDQVGRLFGLDCR